MYEGIPHLLAPVVTDMKHAANALRWCVAEMERRYQLMSALGVRNISGFNRKVKDATDAGKPIRDPVMTAMAANDPTLDQRQIQDLVPLPYIVVIIDELADLMMIVGKKVEELIARLAQKARARGIHLVLATQRPSVDVITGLIKANIPDAHRLPGFGARRFAHDPRPDGRGSAARPRRHALSPAGTSVPTRVHGAFVADAGSASRGRGAEEVRRAQLHRRRARRPERAACRASPASRRPKAATRAENRMRSTTRR